MLRTLLLGHHPPESATRLHLGTPVRETLDVWPSLPSQRGAGISEKVLVVAHTSYPSLTYLYLNPRITRTALSVTDLVHLSLSEIPHSMYCTSHPMRWPLTSLHLRGSTDFTFSMNPFPVTTSCPGKPTVHLRLHAPSSTLLLPWCSPRSAMISWPGSMRIYSTSRI
jgi:hypothetical protein